MKQEQHDAVVDKTSALHSECEQLLHEKASDSFSPPSILPTIPTYRGTSFIRKPTPLGPP
jgi:hypothetical protein